MATGITTILKYINKKLFILLIPLIFALFIPTYLQLHNQIKNTKPLGVRNSVEFIRQNAQPGENVVNYNLRDTLMLFYYSEFSEDLNLYSEPIRANIGSWEKVREILENSKTNTFIVIKIPWPSVRKKYEAEKEKLDAYISKNAEVISKCEETQVIIYYVSAGKE